MANVINDIKKSLKEGKLVVGADETIKGLKTGKFTKIYLAENCPEVLKGDLTRYAGMGGVEVVETGVPNTELGDICKKPFAIAVMGLSK